MKKFLCIAFALPLIIQAQNYAGDSTFIRTLANNVLLSHAAYDNLHFLTKKIGGRLAGSPQMVQAEQWGFKTLKGSGAENVLLQECQVPHWVRGGKDKATIYFTDDKGKQQSSSIDILALGNSVGTGPKGIKAAIIRVNSFDDLELHKSELKGKIVLFNVPFEQTFIETFKAYGKNVIYRAIGASRAAKYGALAVIVRSMTNAEDNNPHTGALQYLDSFPKIPAAAVGLQDLARMNEWMDHGKLLQASIFTNGKMLPDTIGHNVIGEMKGSEYPEEIITIGGHLDSWDVNEGATDDGAGIIQTIEILRAYNSIGFKPKHTIRFVLFANEENGTRGAEKYAAVAKENKEKHVFGLESDAGGFTPRGFSISINDENKAKLESWLPLFSPYGVTAFYPGGGGADVNPLNETFKIPVAELIPDTQRYFDVHHSRSDVLEKVNIREVKLGAINMAALVYLIDKYGL